MIPPGVLAFGPKIAPGLATSNLLAVAMFALVLLMRFWKPREEMIGAAPDATAATTTLAVATALNEHIGYDKATTIVKKAADSGRTLRDVAREALRVFEDAAPRR